MPNKELSYVNYNGTTYNIDAVTVNGHTVQTNVPANYDWNKSKVEISNATASGNNVATITIDGVETNLKSPAYTGTSPISVDNTNLKIEHAASGPANTDTSKGDSSNQTPSFGGTFKALSATVDKYGHTTALTDHTITLPELSNAPTYSSGNGNVLIDTLSIDGTESKIYIPAYPTLETLGLNKALKFIGFSTTAMSDGSSTTPTISGVTGYTPAVGDVVIDGSNASATSQWEYVYTSTNKWERLGGDSSYVIGGTEYDVTNGGTNANSAVTISPKTTAVYSMTSAGSVVGGSEASLTSSVTNEKLTYTWTTNVPTVVTLPGRSSVINAWTGYNTGVANTYAAAQAFTPTTKTITVS